MEKYYRVLKDNFLWKEGVILKFGSKNWVEWWYVPIEDIWNKTEFQTTNWREYISAPIVEADSNKDFFERIYTDDLKRKVFKTKDQLTEFYKNNFKK